MNVRAVLLLFFLTSALGKSVTTLSQVTQLRRPLVKVEPLSSVGRILNPRKFNYGQQKPKEGPLPDPILISSSIQINKDSSYQPPRKHFTKELNKRQIFIQDQTQFNGGQTVQAQSNGEQTIFYTPSQQHPYSLPQDVGGALYGTPAPVQLQTVTAVPVNTNQGQMYLLQQTPQTYSPLTSHLSLSKFLPRTGDPEGNTQNQMSDLMKTQPKVSIVSHADPNSQQDSTKRDHGLKEQKSQQQVQYEEAQQVLQNIIKQQALQQTQQQRQHQFQLAQQIQEQFTIQAQQQAAQAQLEAQTQQQSQGAETQHTNQILLTSSVVPQVGIEAQPSTSQIFHTPTQQFYQTPGGQTYILQKQENTPKEEHREITGQTTALQGQHQTYMLQKSPPSPQGEPTTGSQHTHTPQVTTPQGTKFVIRHQTYVTGPGGQMFTVPVPVPAEQAENSREEAGSREENERAQERKDDEGSRENERRDDAPPPHRHPPRPINSFMRRVMEAFSVRGDASERVGANIALPILASTGVFFGLGALAAGWYLSNANREVGILRRTGKPVPQGTHNVKRIRRQLPTPPPEVDQASFFQTIIQQAIEKQQEQFEDPAATETGLDYSAGPMSPHGRYPPQSRKPLSRHDSEPHYGENSKVGHPSRPIQKKSWLVSRQTINFAKVAIPAVVLGGAVIAIGVLIFGWYITGSNREVAFLEPSAYSRRRKRDLTTTALSDGWLQRLLNSIHENPYEHGPHSKVFDPLASLDGDTSKGNIEYHANVSDAVVAVSLAVVAFFSLLGILFAWLAAQNEKSILGLDGAYGFGGWPGSSVDKYYRRLRRDPSYLHSLHNTFHSAQQNVPKWAESKREK